MGNNGHQYDVAGLCINCGGSQQMHMTLGAICESRARGLASTVEATRAPTKADSRPYGAWELAKDIFTFRGSSRLETAQSIYSDAYRIYSETYGKAQLSQLSTEREIVSLGADVQTSFKLVQAAGRYLGWAADHPSKSSMGMSRNDSAGLVLSAGQLTLNKYSAALSLAQGAAAGAAFTVGSWTMVSVLGSASTGTAIGTLHGVAAYNATLAWFGGGSLATGGAGMAGGAAALTGALAVVAVGVATWSSHSKASEIEKASIELMRADTNNHKLKGHLDRVNLLAIQYRGALNKAYEEFREEVVVAENDLFPKGWRSRLWRWTRSICGGSYFKPTDEVTLQWLQDTANIFAQRFDFIRERALSGKDLDSVSDDWVTQSTRISYSAEEIWKRGSARMAQETMSRSAAILNLLGITAVVLLIAWAWSGLFVSN